MNVNPPAASHAARLREAFDSAFASRPAEPSGAVRRLLLIGVNGNPCAVPMEECAAVHAAIPVTPLPTTLPAFLGVAAIRGAVVPVYDLAAHLGMETQHTHRGWLLVASGRHPIAFVVDRVEGYEEIATGGGAEPAAPSSVVTIDGTARRLVTLGPVVAAIDTAVQRLKPREE